jgi:hypothetical protein
MSRRQIQAAYGQEQAILGCSGFPLKPPGDLDHHTG